MKIFRNIIISLLIVNTLGSALFVPLIYLDFSVRQDYIAKVLCINRDKPMLNCNGSCILAQKLKQAQEQEENSKEITQKLEISFFFNKCPVYELNNTPLELPNPLSAFKLADYSKGHLYAVFHPPQG